MIICSPYKRIPIPCGSDKDVSTNREPTQMNDYKTIISACKDKRVLDVGAGMCEGLKMLEPHALDIRGLDVDYRLKPIHPKLIIGHLQDIPDNSYDIVLAIDVLEHVLEDLWFMDKLKAIATDCVFVSTPNIKYSKCINPAHCREYSHTSFTALFNPTFLERVGTKLYGYFYK